MDYELAPPRMKKDSRVDFSPFIPECSIKWNHIVMKLKAVNVPSSNKSKGESVNLAGAAESLFAEKRWPMPSLPLYFCVCFAASEI